MHTIPLHMGLKCYEQLRRYLHVSYIEVVNVPSYNPFNKEPTFQDEVRMGMDNIGDIWWHKLEPMLSIF